MTNYTLNYKENLIRVHMLGRTAYFSLRDIMPVLGYDKYKAIQHYTKFISDKELCMLPTGKKLPACFVTFRGIKQFCSHHEIKNAKEFLRWLDWQVVIHTAEGGINS